MKPNRDNQIAGMLRGEPPPIKPFSLPKPRPKIGMRRPMPTPKQTPARKSVPAPKPTPPTYENDVYGNFEIDG